MDTGAASLAVIYNTSMNIGIQSKSFLIKQILWNSDTALRKNDIDCLMIAKGKCCKLNGYFRLCVTLDLKDS